MRMGWGFAKHLFVGVEGVCIETTCSYSDRTIDLKSPHIKKKVGNAITVLSLSSKFQIKIITFAEVVLKINSVSKFACLGLYIAFT